MITADTLKRLSTLDHVTLTGLVLGEFANRKDKFTGAKFLGITNGGEFCYTVTFKVEGGTDSTKVFVKRDPATDRVSATAELTRW
jgi:hypothetical protein